MNPFRKKAVMPEPSDVLPGRATPMPVPERHAVNGNRIVPPFPGRHEARAVRPRLFLGRGAQVLAAARRVQHGGRLRGRLDAESDV